MIGSGSGSKFSQSTLVNLMGSVFSYRSCEIERSAYYKMEKAEYQMTGMADKAYSGTIK